MHPIILFCGKKKWASWHSQESHLRTVTGIPLFSPVCSWPPCKKALSWDCLSASDCFLLHSHSQGLQVCLPPLCGEKEGAFCFPIDLCGIYKQVSYFWANVSIHQLNKHGYFSIFIRIYVCYYFASCCTFKIKILKTYAICAFL